jgi:alkylation response protein AidB-like acyl-CoA dehydrogenase
LDFSWSEEQQQLKEAVVKFAREELTSDLLDLDRRGEFDREGWRQCGGFGIHGLPIPKQFGGRGADVLTTVCALEGLGYACRDNGLLFSINAHMWSCELPILIFGTDVQKEQYLPGLCRGDLIGANAMSEPGSGSDAYSLATTAERRGDFYVLNGRKVLITNGPVADVVIVYATLDPSKGSAGISAFLVEKRFHGFSMSPTVEKMGLRTVPMGELDLKECEVPVENRLGKEGAGVAAFTHSMEWERSCILATAVGAMQRQLETCIQYAKRRRQFGQPIGKFQLVSSKIVDMKLRVETARLLLYKVAWLKNAGRFALSEASMAKLHISEAWVQSCMDAMEIHGGYGYLTRTELERELRDALGSKFYSGTSEIQRLIISQTMGF